MLILSQEHTTKVRDYISRIGVDMGDTGAPTLLPVNPAYDFPACPHCRRMPSSVLVTPSTLAGGAIVYEGCEHTFEIPRRSSMGHPNQPGPGKSPCHLCGGSGMVQRPGGGVERCPQAGNPNTHY